MRLLLVVPPQIIKSRDGIDVQPTVSLPLGVLYMAAYLRRQAWPGEFEVYDARLSARFATDEDGRTIFGDSWDTVAKRIADYRPDVVGISNMFSWQIKAAIRVAEVSKDTCPGAVTVLGGPHASSFPVDMVREPSIDYVVMGEGEDRLYKMLQAFERNERVSIQGVLHTEDDATLLRPNKKAPISFLNDMDAIPVPAYDLVDVERYFYLQCHGYSPRVREPGKRAVTILTSRGCPHQCIFCSVQATMGYKFRYHSPDYVKAHIEHLRKNYRIDYIHFEDDNFTHDIDRYEEILDVLLQLAPRITWDTPNGVRADTWTDERIRRTKDSGCQFLVIAIESSVQRVIDEVIKKKLDLSCVEPVMRASRKVGLPLAAFYVLGLPGETAAEIRATVDYAIDKYRRFGVYPTFSMANPLPGTELHDIVVAHDLFSGVTVHDPPRANTIKTGEFDPAYVQAMFDMANERKTWITVREMLTHPRSFVRYVAMSMRQPWFFRRILRSTLRSVASRMPVLREKSA